MMLELFVIYSSYIYIELIASLGAYVKDVIYASEGDSHSVESAPLSSPTTPALSKKRTPACSSLLDTIFLLPHENPAS